MRRSFSRIEKLHHQMLFSLPNLLIAILLMILISALLELIKLLTEWHPLKCSPQNTKAYPIRIS